MFCDDCGGQRPRPSEAWTGHPPFSGVNWAVAKGSLGQGFFSESPKLQLRFLLVLGERVQEPVDVLPRQVIRRGQPQLVRVASAGANLFSFIGSFRGPYERAAGVITVAIARSGRLLGRPS